MLKLDSMTLTLLLLPIVPRVVQGEAMEMRLNCECDLDVGNLFVPRGLLVTGVCSHLIHPSILPSTRSSRYYIAILVPAATNPPGSDLALPRQLPNENRSLEEWLITLCSFSSFTSV